ncbi:MAG: ATP-binding protein [Blastocatellia bacterium]
MKFFNTAGPCNPDWHYMISPTVRLADEDVMHLIGQGGYFVLHAPRRVGKTTAMLALARELTESGKYVAALVTMEVGAGLKGDVGAAELAMLADWRKWIEHFLPAELRPPQWPEAPEGQRINEALSFWAKTAPRPLVVFLDEIDALENNVLISALRQLRSGYPLRPHSFPASLAVIGLRDVRDYKVMSGGGDRLGTGSPFNIAVRSLTLHNFTADEVRELLGQHTAETGQVFADEASQMIFDLTLGQPWLVNSLAKICVEELVKDVAQPVRPEHVEQAREILIGRRHVHFAQLMDKLREERVRRVIEPILAGRTLEDVPEDDRQYVLDLGLCREDQGQGVRIANPIYREVIPRYLAGSALASLSFVKPTWLNADSSLNADRLLESFLEFWRQHGEPLLKSAPYHEVAPHLVMMAYLQRVANGGGILEREYAIGTDRMDLYLRYGAARLGIELKVWRNRRGDPLKRGLTQLDEYLGGLGLESGWLVIFDHRKGAPPISERTATENAVTPSGRAVTVIRA